MVLSRYPVPSDTMPERSNRVGNPASGPMPTACSCWSSRAAGRCGAAITLVMAGGKAWHLAPDGYLPSPKVLVICPIKSPHHPRGLTRRLVPMGDMGRSPAGVVRIHRRLRESAPLGLGPRVCRARASRAAHDRLTQCAAEMRQALEIVFRRIPRGQYRASICATKTTAIPAQSVA